MFFRTLIVSAATLTAVFACQISSPAQTILKGRVQQSGGASLSRSELRRPASGADPFSGGDQVHGQELDVPFSSFEPPMSAPVNQGAYPLAASMEDQLNQVASMPAPPSASNDPDSAPEMQLAWDAWHRRVAAAIFERYNFLAKATFRHSPPLIAKLSYVVTRDGHIQNLQMVQASSNVLYNVLVFQTIKSLDGDMSLLAFPPGSRRAFVNKPATFSQNVGAEGFRYTTGDRETMR